MKNDVAKSENELAVAEAKVVGLIKMAAEVAIILVPVFFKFMDSVNKIADKFNKNF